MLTLELRKLEDAGIVRRTEFDGYPRRVEYDLTMDGERLVPLIDALGDWWDSVAAVPVAVDADLICGRARWGLSRNFIIYIISFNGEIPANMGVQNAPSLETDCRGRSLFAGRRRPGEGGMDARLDPHTGSESGRGKE